MAETNILSGKVVSDAVYAALEDRIKALSDNHSTVPGLAAVIVGEDPASELYVRNKTRRFRNMNLHSETIRLPEETSQKELLSTIRTLNHDPVFHGILVQLPLPKHIDTDVVINAIIPEKDVDGFHPENLGRLTAGKPRFIPCTPKGIMRILEHFHIDPSGKHAVVLGRSNIVGRPMSILLSQKQAYSNATTTICHSGTSDLKAITTQADILVAALGVPEMIDDSYIKEATAIIDVGINRVPDESEKEYKLVGDVNFDAVQGIAGAITPVPGGVGPMTIAMLVENTVEAAESLFS
ncbi:MAG: bifunctional 5,10-methylene-tetrahydrofolate dehydrogenase/5,10-methylene-tetrahydrofolate cyclohydrolase [Candidatus Marinimicrobia bacterium]|nr:bifunctional 5,10-methylene-tetrahydrofolate dehydrogenase/5,10-methylene-tetrahydrofolate cyclohydrolase [Candidatus Neomarinimicrobiota bacterium]